MPDLLLGGIAINEILIDPNGANNFDTDGDGAARGGDEFLELINLSNGAIDISGLELWDDGRGNWFTFPPGTTLQPGATAVVVRNVQNGGSLPTVSGNDLAFDADLGGNVFNNGGDNLVVFDPTSDTYVQATYNGDSLDDPTSYPGFSATATRIGSGENLGNDVDGRTIQRGSNGFTNDATPTPGMENVCFASGTLLETPHGFRPIESLRQGDLLATLDEGYQPIRWIYARKVSAEDLLKNSNLHPIRVDTGAGQASKTTGALYVSRHHRLMVAGKISQRMFGTDQVLAPAKDLLGHAQFSVDHTMNGFFYYHILMDRHAVLNANGVLAESLYLGPQALLAMSPDARAELEIPCPNSDHSMQQFANEASRKIVQGRRAQKMALRHQKNNKAILSLA